MSYSSTVLATAGLTAFWPFDEPSGSVAADALGSADLTIAGGVTLGAATLVADGASAAEFDRATSGRASHGSSYPETNVTVEGMFRCDDLTTSNQCLFFNGSGSNGIGLFLNGHGSSSGELHWIVQGVQWFPTGYVTDGDPHHFAFTRGELSGQVRLYVDGVEEYAQFVDTPVSPSGGFTVGAETAAGGNGFTGALDDVAVYAAELDAATVLAHSDASRVPVGGPDPHETWEELIFDRHNTGANPYDVHAPAPNADEHYDPLLCFTNARDYCLVYGLTPSDWSTEIGNAVANWRDQYILIDAAGGQLQGPHTHTHGLARHYLETQEPESLAALEQILPDTYGVTEQMYRDVFTSPFWQRENAFRLLGMLDRDLCGLGEHESVHWCADIALEHIDHFLQEPEERYGVFVRPFMWGLVLRSLVAYWFHYRDSADATASALVALIPAAVEASVTRIMTVAWWPEGESHNVAFSGDLWDHGMIKYVYPAGDAGTHAPIADVVVQSSASAKVFTGPASLSTVDDFYKYCSIQRSGIGLGYVQSYVGSTRQFTVITDAGETVIAADDVLTIAPVGGDDGAGGYAPDSGAHVLNPLVSPAAAWAYWHRKVVLGDAAGAAAFRTYHEMLWEGQRMGWLYAYTQKEYNEGMIWGAPGIGYRDAGDADAETTFDSLAVLDEPPDPDPGATTHVLLISLPGGNLLMIPQEVA